MGRSPGAPRPASIVANNDLALDRIVENARTMTSVVTAERDLTPYRAITPNIELDDMNLPAQALRDRERWASPATP